MNIRPILLMSASLASVLLLPGCASDQMQKDIAEIRTMAQDAKATADQAKSTADSVKSEADAAMAKAEEAATAAEAAQSCCEDNKARVNRMFRKAMNK